MFLYGFAGESGLYAEDLRLELRARLLSWLLASISTGRKQISEADQVGATLTWPVDVRPCAARAG